MKTSWKKEKLLVMSNFSFLQNVSRRLVLQTRACLGEGQPLKISCLRLKLKFNYHTLGMKLVIVRVENNVGKMEKMLVARFSSFSYNVFQSFLSQDP